MRFGRIRQPAILWTVFFRRQYETYAELGLMTHGISQQSTMNHSPDYDHLIKRGYRYYIDQCKKNLEELSVNDVADFEKENCLGIHDNRYGSSYRILTQVCGFS